MKNYKKKRSMKWPIVLAVLITLASLTVAAAFVFRITDIEYVGSKHYTSDELNQTLFNGKSPNALVYFLFKRNEQKAVPFIQRYDIEIEWPSKMLITVYEKSIIGYVNYMGCNMYFDRDGIVVDSSTRALSGIPQISGLRFSSIVLNSKLEVGDAAVFDKILDLTQAFDKYSLSADKIYFGDSSSITLTIGDVKVLLGDAADLTDRLYELKMILPQLANLKGTLHLENYTGDQSAIIFKQNQSE